MSWRSKIRLLRFGVALLAAVAFLAGCIDNFQVRVRLPPSLRFYPGAINAIAVERGARTISFYGSPAERVGSVDKVFLTHHRRDVVWASLAIAREGARVVAPAAELRYLEGAAAFWDEFRGARFHDYAQKSTKILAAPLTVQEPVSGGDSIEWQDLTIEVLDTPGYTRGAVTYLINLEGRRIAFTGDLIYEGGKILDLYSLQDSIEETETRGYHGYAARAADAIQSLRKLAEAEPDIIVPVRGPVILEPAEDIERLISRLERLFLAYFRTDALRWYWGEENLAKRARRILGDQAIEWMPMATRLRQTPPSWWHKFGTSRLIVSRTKKAFLIDCGSEDAMRQVDRLRRRRVFDKLEGIFITHFHDDHTDFVQEMAAAYDAPVYAGKEVQDILENPAAYRMPAMTDKPIRPVQALTEGQTLRWHEFEFEYTYFPGQAIYHGGLDVRRDNGERYFFVGDSFSPSGLDDYCMLNRHLLHPNLGHFRCLDKIRAIEGDYWLVNQHIDEVFRYDDEQLATMKSALMAKKLVIAELVPWKDPNFGIDEQWVRFYPYGLEARPGEGFDLYAVVFNHSPEAETFRVEPNLPDGWDSLPKYAEIHVDARQEDQLRFRITPGSAASGGLNVITADVRFSDHDLREWIEAMIEVRR